MKCEVRVVRVMDYNSQKRSRGCYFTFPPSLALAQKAMHCEEGAGIG